MWCGGGNAGGFMLGLNVTLTLGSGEWVLTTHTLWLVVTVDGW